MISATPEQFSIIACRAIEAQKAKQVTTAAKHVYHDSWRCFEAGMDDFDPDADYEFYIDPHDRICVNHPDFDAARMATKKWYEAYQAAKRAEYNAKRRLETAIRAIS